MTRLFAIIFLAAFVASCAGYQDYDLADYPVAGVDLHGNSEASEGPDDE